MLLRPYGSRAFLLIVVFVCALLASPSAGLDQEGGGHLDLLPEEAGKEGQVPAPSTTPSFPSPVTVHDLDEELDEEEEGGVAQLEPSGDLQDEDDEEDDEEEVEEREESEGDEGQRGVATSRASRVRSRLSQGLQQALNVSSRAVKLTRSFKVTRKAKTFLALGVLLFVFRRALTFKAIMQTLTVLGVLLELSSRLGVLKVNVPFPPVVPSTSSAS